VLASPLEGGAALSASESSSDAIIKRQRLMQPEGRSSQLFF